jgi:hypothetical protein
VYVFSGYLDNPANSALFGSGPGFQVPPSFGDETDIANNVAQYVLTVDVPGLVRFTSQGYAAGGVDPYFTVFSGTGADASFLVSNYDQAFTTGGDFDFTAALDAGDYTVALGAFANMSFAENYGTGTLGDGFIGLGEPAYLGNAYYQLTVVTPTPAVSEPPSVSLLAISLLGLAASRTRRLMDRTNRQQRTRPAARH